jgi:hypothetical protein
MDNILVILTPYLLFSFYLFPFLCFKFKISKSEEVDLFGAICLGSVSGFVFCFFVFFLFSLINFLNSFIFYSFSAASICLALVHLIKGNTSFTLKTRHIIYLLTIFVGTYVITRHIEFDLFALFKGTDPIFSFNLWANLWAKGKIPMAWRYPQLMPTNFALPYLFIGNSKIQFFSLWFTLSMPFLLLIHYLRISIIKKSFAYIVGAIILLHFFSKSPSSQFMYLGFADFPLFVFMTLSVSQFDIVLEKQDSSLEKYILFFYLCAAGLTKQLGVLLIPYLLYLAYKHKRKDLVILIFTAGTLTASWYLYNEYRIFTGAAVDLLDTLLGNDLHENRSLLERGKFATTMVYKEIFKNKFNLILISHFFVVLGCFKSRKFIFLALGLFILWAFGFSYDIRSFFPAFSILFYLFCIGLHSAFSWIGIKLTKREATHLLPRVTSIALESRNVFNRKISYSLLACLVLISSLVFVYNYDIESKVRSHIEKKINIGIPVLNQKLLELYQQRREKNNFFVITNYTYGLYFNEDVREMLIFNHLMNDVDVFMNQLKQSQNQYILQIRFNSPRYQVSVFECLNRLEKKGILEWVWKSSDGRLGKINHKLIGQLKNDCVN